MSTGESLRVVLHTGALFRHDAISGSLFEKLAALEHARRQGAPVEARAVVGSSEVAHPAVDAVDGAVGALHHPWFFSADLHIYEFGIWYEAFDTVFAVPRQAATVASYHNVTSPWLARDSDHRLMLERSCGKKANLSVFDHVACISEFSYDEVVGMGIDVDRVSVVPLPPSIALSPDLRRSPSPDAPVELLYLGRFVVAKGVLDLLRAIPKARALSPCPFRVTFAGNERLSDADVLAATRALAEEPELAGCVRLAGEPDEGELAELYASIDALVLPSYHEGYCVPVVEAVSAGAHVITSDAGNLPNIVRNVGRTVPAGDVDALAAAIADLVGRLARTRRGEALEVVTDAGVVDETTWKDRVNEHRRRHSREAFRGGFFSALAAALRHAGRDVPGWISASI